MNSMSCLFFVIVLIGLLFLFRNLWHDALFAKKKSSPVLRITNESFFALPYPYNALDPIMDEQTVLLHYGKHHYGYYEKVLKALSVNAISVSALSEYLKDPSDLPFAIRQEVINQGGGYVNHVFYWQCMAPLAHSNVRSAEFEAAIITYFGSFDAFKEMFLSVAEKQFGSGWTWLVIDATGALKIIKTANQDSPLTIQCTPLLVVDVWEHAYYLCYQNRRREYLDGWWQLINWSFVSQQYQKEVKTK